MTKWASMKPTVAGWYWVRHVVVQCPTIVNIELTPDSKRLLCEPHNCFVDDMNDFEWCGPLVASFDGIDCMKWRDMKTAPLDGSRVIIIKTNLGAVSAWFCSDSYEWVCHDDQFALEHEAALGWIPMPDDE